MYALIITIVLAFGDHTEVVKVNEVQTDGVMCALNMEQYKADVRLDALVKGGKVVATAARCEPI